MIAGRGMKRIVLKILVFLISLTTVLTFTQLAPAGHTFHEEFHLVKARTEPVFLDASQSWVDSVMQSLTPEERIAQLFMVAAYSNKDKTHEEEIEKIVQHDKRNNH